MTSFTQPPPSTEPDLEERLSRPTDRLLDALARFAGDVIVLGAGGKMGPTLARMARRSLDEIGSRAQVIAVSRFRSEQARTSLENAGVQTISGDLSDASFVQSLPTAPNVIYMAGFKFGASQSPATAWGLNCYPPALVCQRFRDSRIAAFSTGNVYGLTPVNRGGSQENDTPRPVGEYAMAALGRERMFQFFSEREKARVVLLRLNYAVDLRYGVLIDLAQQILADQVIDASMGYVNLIWQRDANAMALASLEHAASPPKVLNIAGRDILSIRRLAEQLAQRLNKQVTIANEESCDALLSDGQSAYPHLGEPQTPIEEVIGWTVDWVRRGGKLLGKPTHFQERGGDY